MLHLHYSCFKILSNTLSYQMLTLEWVIKAQVLKQPYLLLYRCPKCYRWLTMLMMPLITTKCSLLLNLTTAMWFLSCLKYRQFSKSCKCFSWAFCCFLWACLSSPRKGFIVDHKYSTAADLFRNHFWLGTLRISLTWASSIRYVLGCSGLVLDVQNPLKHQISVSIEK